MSHEFEFKAVTPEEFVQNLEELVRQMQENKYAFQVGLSNVEFSFDEEIASSLATSPEMTPIDEADLYLRQKALIPTQFSEYDGTEHQVLVFDPEAVGFSGFAGCVTHSLVLTDQGLFEVGRYAAISLTAARDGAEYPKYWQWFLHRRLATAEKVRQWQEENDLSDQQIVDRVFSYLTGRPRDHEEDNPLKKLEEEALFPFGQVVATPGALKALEEADQTPLEYLGRHVTGDWGDLEEFDQKENEIALRQGLRIFSHYHLPTDRRLYVITEADRSVTTLLLPEEY